MGVPKVSALSKSRRGANRIFSINNMALLVFLALLWVVVAQLTPYFFRPSNILNLLNTTATVVVAGVGMTFVIISGGVDLSVGGVAALAGMVVGICISQLGLAAFLAVALGLVAGLTIGFVNGLLVSSFKLQAMIATLGTLSISRGLTLISTSGRPVFIGDPVLNAIGNGSVFGIPIPVVIAAVVLGVGHVVLTYTEFGRYVYAVGGNEEATRLSGINVRRTKIAIYMISGFCAALDGVLLVGILGASEPTVGQGLELDAIAVTAIGGTSLMGGVGGLIGTGLGAVLIGTIKNSLTLLNIVSYWQQVIIGVVIIVAVLLEYFRRRRS